MVHGPISTFKHGDTWSIHGEIQSKSLIYTSIHLLKGTHIGLQAAAGQY